MKINKAEIFELAVPGEPKTWHPVVIRIHTDEGVSGVGEAGLAYGCGHSGAAGMLANMAEQFLLGKDPRRIEEIWNILQTQTFWGYSPGPIFYAAISAIDIALWDIKGKLLGQPIHQLLGGPCHDSIRAYASQVQFGWGAGEEQKYHQPEDLARTTRAMIEDGYDCVKINPVRYDKDGNFLPHLGPDIPGSTLDVMAERVRAVREAGGRDLDILVEHNSRCSVEAASRLAQRLEEFDCLYLEEPVHFMDPSLTRDLKERTRIPLAGGERFYTRWQFLPYLRERLISLAQPDVCLAGGITETKKICDLAHIFGIQVQMHVCGGPVCVAASLHVAAAAVNYVFQEHFVRLLRPGNRSLVLEDYQPVKGYFALPDKPGLGIELNDDVVNRSPKKVIS
ncbi:MAG: mandelate racemase/muconate lactonizing enzyme family protein [Candidatus Accumulibacter sp.]|jgi:L-alanine-DL-glutamate epimerase-like enolase superfamily enzyme|nr:mandelate racemase/muconate lactonizing enzyme family protein [Accumulibacter sp.]